MIRFGPYSAVVLLVMGCSSGPIDISAPAQSAGDRPPAYDDRPFATVLRENVRDGLVDYAHLHSHRGPLDEFLAMVAESGPRTTPDLFDSPQARGCYYINAYNAAILAAVLRMGTGVTLHKLEFGSVDHRFRVMADGRFQTLAQLRHAAVEETGRDVRVVFALCDAAFGSPPLHVEPFRSTGLDETLRLVAQHAMDNHRIVAVDHENQALLLSTIMMDRRDDFLAFFKRRTGAKDATMLNVVLHFAGTVRRQWLNTAVGYSERMIPFDRQLNKWPADAE